MTLTGRGKGCFISASHMTSIDKHHRGWPCYSWAVLNVLSLLRLLPKPYQQEWGRAPPYSWVGEGIQASLIISTMRGWGDFITTWQGWKSWSPTWPSVMLPSQARAGASGVSLEHSGAEAFVFVIGLCWPG